MDNNTVFDNMPLFIQNIIRKNGLKYKNYVDLKNLEYNIENAIVLNYVASINMIILRNHCHRKFNKLLTDNVLLKYALISKKGLLDSFITYSVDYLSNDDKTKILNDMQMIMKIFENVLSKYNKERLQSIYKACVNMKFSYFAKKQQILFNIREKEELDSLGFQNYLNTNMNRFLNNKKEEFDILFQSHEVEDEQLNHKINRCNYLVNKLENDCLNVSEINELRNLKCFIDSVNDYKQSKLYYKKH